MSTKALTRASLLLALLIILGWAPPISFGLPVPIVLQNLGIFLIVGLLPWRQASLLIGGFLLCALIGLPILSGMRGGWPVFVGPTGGYLLGWLLTPIAYQLVATSLTPLSISAISRQLICLLIGGVLLTDLLGNGWLILVLHLPIATALLGNLVFIPGDLLKVTVAATILPVLIRQLSHAASKS